MNDSSAYKGGLRVTRYKSRVRITGASYNNSMEAYDDAFQLQVRLEGE